MNKLKLILSIIVLITLTPIFSHAKLPGNQRATLKAGMYERKFKKVNYTSYGGWTGYVNPPESGTYDEWSPYLIITFYKNGTPAYIRESDGGGSVPITYLSTEGDEITYQSEGINKRLSNGVIETTYYGIVFIGGIESRLIRFINLYNSSSNIFIKTYTNCKEF